MAQKFFLFKDSHSSLDDVIFKYACILSVMAHLALLAQFSYMNTNYFRNPLKKLEVTYYNVKPDVKETRDQVAKKADIKDPGQRSAEITLEKKFQPPPFLKDISKLAERIITDVKQPVAITHEQVKRSVSIPPVKSEKINSPAYQSYTGIIRSMIEKRAYANYTKLDTGSIYVAFIVLPDGTLKQSRIVEEKTDANDYLKTISLRSVQEATPFPPLPQNLNYPELPIGLTIEFKVEK
ncbi:MAG: hypothetical protein WC676_07430 [Candidatus Omnitrophota bacterium]